MRLAGVSGALSQTFSCCRYDIVNFQKQNGSTYDFVRIATWDSDTLSVFRDPTWKKGDAEIPKSLCGLPCSKGQVRVSLTGSVDFAYLMPNATDFYRDLL